MKRKDGRGVAAAEIARGFGRIVWKNGLKMIECLWKVDLVPGTRVKRPLTLHQRWREMTNYYSCLSSLVSH